MIEDLCAGFWTHIIECLIAGDMETRAWLDTGGEPTGFLWWCDVSGKDPQHWRTRLLRAWEVGPTLKEVPGH